MFKTIALWVTGFLVIIGLGWFLNANYLAQKAVFAPINQQIDRKVFEESKSYRQGAVQELQNMQFEYIKASPEHKLALASIIRHRAADVPRDAMPSDLHFFIRDLPK